VDILPNVFTWKGKDSLFPFSGTWWLGCQIIKDTGDARNVGNLLGGFLEKLQK